MREVRSFFILLISIFVVESGYSQSAEVKLNVAAAAVAIFNPSVEVDILDSSAVTFDYVGIFAKEDYLGTGYPLVVSMGLFGYRYYFKQSERSGLFVGGDVGCNMYRMNKNVIPLVTSDHHDEGYDVGYGYLLGATVGYKYCLSSRFTLEASVSGGWSYSMHEGYSAAGVKQYDLNPSGEWTPYKAAISLGYKLGRR